MAIFWPIIMWFMRAFLPYAFILGGFIVAYIFGWLEGFFFFILVQFLTIAEMFVGWVSEGTSIFNYLTFSGLPREVLVFAVFLKVPEVISIIMGAYAIRLMRKAILRF